MSANAMWSAPGPLHPPDTSSADDFVQNGKEADAKDVRRQPAPPRLRCTARRFPHSRRGGRSVGTQPMLAVIQSGCACVWVEAQRLSETVRAPCGAGAMHR